MATSTANYGLRKPAPADTVDVTTDLATPYDTIDTNLKRVDEASLASRVSRWNRKVLQAGILFTTPNSSAETDVPKLALSSIPIVNGTLYHFLVRLSIINPSVVNDDFQVHIRRTTAVTGTEIEKYPNFVKAVNLDHIFELHGFWIADIATGNESFFVSIHRAFGTGVCTVQGDGLTKFSMWADPPTVTSTVEVP